MYCPIGLMYLVQVHKLQRKDSVSPEEMLPKLNPTNTRLFSGVGSTDKFDLAANMVHTPKTSTKRNIHNKKATKQSTHAKLTPTRQKVPATHLCAFVCHEWKHKIRKSQVWDPTVSIEEKKIWWDDSHGASEHNT